jgi:hypothetical protein
MSIIQVAVVHLKVIFGSLHRQVQRGTLAYEHAKLCFSLLRPTEGANLELDENSSSVFTGAMADAHRVCRGSFYSGCQEGDESAAHLTRHGANTYASASHFSG